MDLQTTQVTFDSIKRFDEFGNEYWSARELMKALGYAKWQNFEEVLKKAVISIRNAQKDSNYWLTESSKPIISGKGVCGEYIDYKLSGCECYIVAQCGDAKKIQIAQAVRKTIEEIGGTMPENLPTPEKSIQEIEKEKKKFLKNGNS